MAEETRTAVAGFENLQAHKCAINMYGLHGPYGPYGPYGTYGTWYMFCCNLHLPIAIGPGCY